MTRPIYIRETYWGVHRVFHGFGKYEGQFIAESSGWGGARGYFRVFADIEAAKAHVDRQAAPTDVTPPEEKLSWF